MSNPEVISIDGVDYRRTDTISVDRSGSPVKIVIGQRGWVWVGYTSVDGEHLHLSGARCIRYWGTSNGLGELVDGPTAETKLDPAGDVTIHELAVIATYGVDADKWKDHLG